MNLYYELMALSGSVSILLYYLYVLIKRNDDEIKDTQIKEIVPLVDNPKSESLQKRIDKYYNKSLYQSQTGHRPFMVKLTIHNYKHLTKYLDCHSYDSRFELLMEYVAYDVLIRFSPSCVHVSNNKITLIFIPNDKYIPLYNGHINILEMMIASYASSRFAYYSSSIIRHTTAIFTANTCIFPDTCELTNSIKLQLYDGYRNFIQRLCHHHNLNVDGYNMSKRKQLLIENLGEFSFNELEKCFDGYFVRKTHKHHKVNKDIDFVKLHEIITQ